MKNRTLYIIGALVTLGLLIAWINISGQRSSSFVVTGSPDVNILYAGRSNTYQDDLPTALDQAGLISWNTIVFGGDSSDKTSKSLNLIEKTATKVSDNIAIMPGPTNIDNLYFTDKELDRSYVSNGIQHIFLNTINPEQDCSFNDQQMTLLRDSLEQTAEQRILYVFSSWWVDEQTTPTIIKKQPALECDSTFWAENVKPLIEDTVDIVISGDASGLLDETSGNTRYISVGARNKNPGSLMPFIRISRISGNLVVDEFELVAASRVDSSAYKKLPKYEVKVDGEQLRQLFNQLPIYDRAQLEWIDLLESEDGAGAAPLEGTIIAEGTEYTGSISTRGSLGNHWEALKKSWTLEWILEDESVKQLKFIMPSDRTYINQLFVQAINDSDELSILSPRQGVARLVINGIDFGPYLTYDDFDKVFVELSQYGSDTDLVSGKFRDLFARYPSWEDLNYLEKSGPNLPKQDKSLYQEAIKFDGPFTRFKDVIEKKNYRDWMASQIFTGDFHQNANNNMRLFLDRSTGRYQILSWDQFYGLMKSAEDMLNLHGTSYFQFAILKDPTEKAEIYKIVASLMKNEQQYVNQLSALEDQYTDVFVNDPYASHNQDRMIELIGSVRERFENNMAILKEAL